MRYRKLPAVIDAFQWTGGPDQLHDPEWASEAIASGKICFENIGTPEVALLIDTIEGTMRADRGDWIIRGFVGEIYPCKPDVFERTYEAVA